MAGGPGFADNYTLVLMSWGQFITHDMSLSPAFTYGKSRDHLVGLCNRVVSLTEDGTSPLCCTESGQHLKPSDVHPSCLPIDIPDDDFFYSPHNQSCMSLVRTMVGTRDDCTFGYAEQLLVIQNCNSFQRE